MQMNQCSFVIVESTLTGAASTRVYYAAIVTEFLLLNWPELFYILLDLNITGLVLPSAVT